MVNTTKNHRISSLGNKLAELVLMLGEDILEEQSPKLPNLSNNMIFIPYYNPSISQPSKLHPAEINLRKDYGRTNWQVIQKNQYMPHKNQYPLRIYNLRF